jgi:hypothetical protein
MCEAKAFGGSLVSILMEREIEKERLEMEAEC